MSEKRFQEALCNVFDHYGIEYEIAPDTAAGEKRPRGLLDEFAVFSEAGQQAVPRLAVALEFLQPRFRVRLTPDVFAGPGH